ncbi:DUF7310 family coiled-coil domain-containing protein [Halopiger thermotolerans]
MTDLDRLEQRLSAVERVVVDGDATLDELADVAAIAETVADLETRVDEHERRLADLEAAVQSLEGYVGNVESITDDVERQAASAVATVDRLERRVDRLEVELGDVRGGVLARTDETVVEDARSDTDAGADEVESESGFEFNDAAKRRTEGADEPTRCPSLEATTESDDDESRSDTATARTPEETATDIVAGADDPGSLGDETGTGAGTAKSDRTTEADDEVGGDAAESGLLASVRAWFP